MVSVPQTRRLQAKININTGIESKRSTSLETQKPVDERIVMGHFMQGGLDGV